MKKNIAISALTTHKDEIMKKFGVVDIALFGSTSRDTAGPQSDVDILVTFDGPATSKRYFDLLFYLEDLFDSPVDLITNKALRPELRPYIEKEAIHV